MMLPTRLKKHDATGKAAGVAACAGPGARGTAFHDVALATANGGLSGLDRTGGCSTRRTFHSAEGGPALPNARDAANAALQRLGITGQAF